MAAKTNCSASPKIFHLLKSVPDSHPSLCKTTSLKFDKWVYIQLNDQYQCILFSENIFNCFVSVLSTLFCVTFSSVSRNTWLVGLRLQACGQSQPVDLDGKPTLGSDQRLLGFLHLGTWLMHITSRIGHWYGLNQQWKTCFYGVGLVTVPGQHYLIDTWC